MSVLNGARKGTVRRFLGLAFTHLSYETSHDLVSGVQVELHLIIASSGWCLCYLFMFEMGLTVEPWLTWNSVCRPGLSVPTEFRGQRHAPPHPACAFIIINSCPFFLF